MNHPLLNEVPPCLYQVTALMLIETKGGLQLLVREGRRNNPAIHKTLQTGKAS